MDWRNAVRAALHLKRCEGRHEAVGRARILECVKNNYAPLGEPIRLDWEKGVLAVEGAVAPYERAAAERVVEEIFLEILEEFEASGREARPTDSRTGAPVMFAAHPRAIGQRMTVKAFKRAMERLLADKRILIVRRGPPSRQVQKLVRA